MQHVFIIGAKGFTYGGYETFLDKLTERHQDNEELRYHIACKANGPGATDEKKLKGVKILSDIEFFYHNAHCFKIKSPEWGAAQAIIYDIKAIRYCFDYIKKNNIEHPIIYVLSSRIGPVLGYCVKRLHKVGGVYYNNPDGREGLRKKYHIWVRKYWNFSECLMVKWSDLVICDSVTIERYIKSRYKKYYPKTIFIAYGSDIAPSPLLDDSSKYVEWLKKYGLKDKNFYYSVGRFVPENNFEIMIREFMESKTTKDFAIITTKDDKFLSALNRKLHFDMDKRIKFVGTVYDQELLKKIRENAYGYFHGHEVGGTNPSLLEALGSTKLNFLYKVGFNQEVAEDAALYWNKKKGNLAALIDKADQMEEDAITDYGIKAKKRITDMYSWERIADKYQKIFLNMQQII